jgi:P27 family predicted phage terminase small subunit
MARPALTPEELRMRPPGTKSKAKQDEPSVIAAGRPKPPKHLCPDALVEFRRVSKLLDKRKTETPGDYSALAVYAECYSRWIEAKKVLADEGLMIDVTVTDSNGAAHMSRRLNPLIRVVENCERQLLTLARAMGLTPDTRAKVKPAVAPPPKVLSAEEEYFARHLDRPRNVLFIPGQEEESQ